MSESILKPVGMTAMARAQECKKQVAQCIRPGEVGVAFNEEPRWGCNIRDIIATNDLQK